MKCKNKTHPKRKAVFHVGVSTCRRNPTPKKGAGAGIQDCNMSDFDVPNPTRHLRRVHADCNPALPLSRGSSQTHYTAFSQPTSAPGPEPDWLLGIEYRLCYCPFDQKHPCFRKQSSLLHFIPVRSKTEFLSFLRLLNLRLPRDTVSHRGATEGWGLQQPTQTPWQLEPRMESFPSVISSGLFYSLNYLCSHSISKCWFYPSLTWATLFGTVNVLSAGKRSQQLV